jgi:hypothetical protein
MDKKFTIITWSGGRGSDHRPRISHHEGESAPQVLRDEKRMSEMEWIEQVLSSHSYAGEMAWIVDDAVVILDNEEGYMLCCEDRNEAHEVALRMISGEFNVGEWWNAREGR